VLGQVAKVVPPISSDLGAPQHRIESIEYEKHSLAAVVEFAEEQLEVILGYAFGGPDIVGKIRSLTEQRAAYLLCEELAKIVIRPRCVVAKIDESAYQIATLTALDLSRETLQKHGLTVATRAYHGEVVWARFGDTAQEPLENHLPSAELSGGRPEDVVRVIRHSDSSTSRLAASTWSMKS
jgi:hypothetical protein